MKKCIIKSCIREVSTRGLCPTCSAMAYKIISEGKTTWADLEKASLALPCKRKTKGTGDFSNAFNSLTSKKGK